MSATRSELDYSYKIDFQNGRENQDFGRQIISMSWPPLELNTIGMNKTNITTSPIDLMTIVTKIPEPMPRTRPTESLTRPIEYLKWKGKPHVPADPESDPWSSDSSSSKSDFLADSNYNKSKSKTLNKKKRFHKHKKHDSSDSSSSDYDLFNNSDCRRKIRKKKIHQKKDPIKLSAKLTAKLLTTEYKSKIIKFKINEDPLQRRIYLIIFVESLEMIFHQYKETCEVLLDYPK